jgi:hypothetical protein
MLRPLSSASRCQAMPAYTPTLLQHVNLAVPNGSLHLATEFYGTVIGFASDEVPSLQRDSLLWCVSHPYLPDKQVQNRPRSSAGMRMVAIDLCQIHVAFERGGNHPHPTSSRHPCFTVPSLDALAELQNRIWAHHRAGSAAAALECDEPGEENSGSKVSHSVTKSRLIDRDRSIPLVSLPAITPATALNSRCIRCSGP